MSAANPPEATLCARAAGDAGGAGASNAELIPLLREDAANGLSRAQSSEKHGISPMRLSGLAFRNGIKFKREIVRAGGLKVGDRGGLPPLTFAMIAACFSDGLSREQAAKRLGFSPRWVGDFAARYGITFRHGNSGPKKRNGGGTSPAAPNHCTAEPHRLHAPQHEDHST